MALSTGSRVGPYEVLRPLGAGGMGEVYRARDTRLAREVALKVLPDIFAGDAERLARFQREARTLASLNHPHIAQLHGLEDDGTTCALVMELVEGEDLAERIKRGPIPLAEALGMAKQIVEALDAAHGQGIVHRDLKPANIKIRDDDTVKVLDFGLAKALEGRSADSAHNRDSVNSPTITTPAMTLQGVILGTAAYMAPEQAKGRVVDRRADIWAFGCVLYEMVTGRRAFAGDDVTDTLAAVLRADVDWTGVPGSVVRLLKKCLEKDPKRRLQDIGDAWDLIDEDRGPALAGPSPRSWVAWSAAAVFLLTTIALGWVHFRETTPVPMPVRFHLQPPPHNSFDIYLAVSPDGRRVAFTARDEKGLVSLWVRDLGSLEARQLPGTEGAWSPFWSPDSGSLAFSDGQMLKKIDIAGGPPQTLCEINGLIGLGSWGRDGVIVFGSRAVGPLRRVPANGGVPAPITTLEHGASFHSFPAFLPDGRRFLYFRGGDRDRRGIYLGSLDVPPEQQSATRMLPAELGPVQVVSDGSRAQLLYLREQTVMSQPFDLERAALVGEPVRVIERVGSSGSFAFFGAVPGVLAYRTGSAAATATGQLTWIDRTGQSLETIGEPDAYTTQRGTLALAPDATRVAVGIAPTLRADIWLIEFERSIRTRFTFHEVTENFPVWSPDGGRLAFASNREGRNDLYVKNLDGTADETLLHRTSEGKVPTDWSHDGRFLLFVTTVVGRSDLWVLPVDNPGAATALLATPFNESDARFSPDGRWVAYVSNESGRNEIYLRPFAIAPDGRPGLGARWQVSAAGGTYPRWRRDGRELFYRAPDGAVVAVDVTVTQGTARTGRPRPLFTLPPTAINWDVSPDGQRFLVAAPATTAPSADPIAVVLNWQGTRP